LTEIDRKSRKIKDSKIKGVPDKGTLRVKRKGEKG
jgi:hypothetical protein